METPTFVVGKSLVPMLKNTQYRVRESALSELQVNTGNGLAQGYSIKTNRYRLSKWEDKGILSYELYDHHYDKVELNNLANHIDYLKVKDSLINILDTRVVEAQTIPRGLGRQIKNAKPWFEPRKIATKSKK